MSITIDTFNSVLCQFDECTCCLPSLLLYDRHRPPDCRECLESPTRQLTRHLQRKTVGHFDEVAKHVSHCDVFCIAVEAEVEYINKHCNSFASSSTVPFCIDCYWYYCYTGHSHEPVINDVRKIIEMTEGASCMKML